MAALLEDIRNIQEEQLKQVQASQVMIDQVETNVVETVVHSQESGNRLKSAAKLKY